MNTSTRNDKTIDLFYSNNKDSHTCKAMPPIGNSDHNKSFLMPTYVTKCKSIKPIEKTVKVWNESNIDKLQFCFERTDWLVFI